VTRHPTAEWLARQITEAFPWASAPTYLVRDNDRCVCRKPRPFDLVKESRTVGHDGCAAPLPFEAVGFAVQADQSA
jgi:hypothetical protein